LTKYYERDEIKEAAKVGVCSTHGEMRNSCKILVGKPEWKRLHG